MVEHLPEETAGDDLHRAARAALAGLPIVGGAAVELFNRLLAPPIQQRRDAWLDGLAERIEKLEQEERVKVEDLRDNDEFVSTVMQASQVAVRNHQQEKIDALRNAVLNTAIGQAPDDAKREMFLGLVDVFSVIHLRILQALADSSRASDRRPHIALSIGSIAELAVQLLPDLRPQAEFVEVIVEDLCRSGLLFWNRDGGATNIGQGATQVSELGSEFLRFISEPKEDG